MDFVGQAQQQWQKQAEDNKAAASHQELLDVIHNGQTAQMRAILGLARVLKTHQPKVTVKNPIKSVDTPEVRRVVQELQTLVDLEKREKDDTVTPIVEAVNRLTPVLEALKTDIPDYPTDISVNNLSELTAQLKDIHKTLKAQMNKEPETITVTAPEVHVDAPNIDVSSITKALGRLEKAVTDKSEPVFDNSAVIEGLNAVKDQIAGIRFPIPNVITDPLIKYKVADIDDAGTVKYFGQIANDGSWVIMKEDDGATPKTIRYATGSGSYPTNWTGRTGLTYDYLYVAING